MRTFKILIAVIVVAMLFSCRQRDGSNYQQLETLSAKILNGSLVDPVVSPQIVNIALLSQDGATYGCSGTVIGSDSILTSAHCFFGDIIAVNIFSGSELTPTVHLVSQIILHPNLYVDETVNAIFNDVAVVKTATPHNLPALPIIVSHPVIENSLFTVYGFGLDENQEFGRLKSGVSQAFIVTENHIFGPPSYGSEVNPCFGDSGGPIVQSYTDETGLDVYGIVGSVSSGTTDNCVDGDHTLYTNLQNVGIVSFLAQTVPDLVLK